MVVTSDGGQGRGPAAAGLSHRLRDGGKERPREQAGWNLGGRRNFSFFTQDAVEEIAAKAVSDAVQLFDAVQPPAGEMPVVLGPA